MSEFDNNELMNEIRKYQLLYDKSLKDFQDNDKRNQAWEEIAITLGAGLRGIDQLKTRYRTIRTKFSKYLRKIDAPPGCASTISLKPEYEKLRWLIIYIQKRTR